jgi:hypothetical protein
MEVLFRFNIVRDANTSADELKPIDLAADTRFQQAAAAIPGGRGRREKLHQLARAFIDSDQFRSPLPATPLLGPLLSASAAIDRLLDNGPAATAEVAAVLEAALGQKPDVFLEADGLPGEIDALKDSILAIKISPADHSRPILRLASVLRAYALVQRLVGESGFPVDASALREAQQRPMRVPAAVLPTHVPPPDRARPPEVSDRLKEMATRYDRLTAAVEELRRVRPGGFAVMAQRERPEVLPPERLRPLQLFEQELDIRGAALKSALTASASGVTGEPARGVDADSLARLATVSIAAPYLKASALSPQPPVLEVARGARIALGGRPEFQPTMPGLVGLRLSQATQDALSAETRQLLADLFLDPTEPLARTLDRLIQERRNLHEAAQGLMRPLAQKTFRRVGGTTVAVTSSPYPAMFGMAPGALLDLAGALPATPERVPATHADIKPSGVMELLLVRQQLKGYEAAEVSHIANVLKGEKTERAHRVRLETESVTLVETERTVATEQELQTTDRFEIRRESELVLQEETAAKGSLTIKGKYGPTVEFQASGEVSWGRKSQETERAASEFSREVTQKASEKVTERVLRRETLRINRQVEESNLHAFDNSVTPSGHISGVYQFVSKLYEAQVFNYGPRSVYDIMLPEPGAFLLEAFRRRRTAAVELEKPADFELRPSDLNESNYQTYIALYGATDVKPPPEPFLMESYDFNTGGEDKDQEFTNSTRIKVPEGYQAIRATVGKVVAIWDGWSVDVVIGQRGHRFDGAGWVWSTSLDEETGSVPFAVVTDKVGDIAVAVEVICEATDRAIDLWRAETHARLYSAYRVRVSEYEAKLAELEVQAPAEIVSGPSQRNHALMEDEVKRACISLLTEQHFDLFDAIEPDASGLPQLDFAEVRAEGAYVRFFEQAFEWENLSWVPYAYFWGRKSTWPDRIAIEDDDVDFQAFLKAGYLRVQIPVRPGFADALDHFRLHGEVWSGGPLPTISDDLYLPIATEIAEKLGRPGDEVAVGEPWEVRVATSLVKLRADDQLPGWSKQPDGSWLPN